MKISEEYFQIISADSIQIYRYLDIGSCKSTIEQRNLVPHHLINIVDPDYRFTAGDFCREASVACKKIFENGKFPLFVGGCAFYIDAFFKGLSEIPAVDRLIREELNLELSERGLNLLYDELKLCDSVFAERVHANDKQRIVRGLEVYRGTGRPLSSYYNERNGNESSETLYLGIRIEREESRKRIDQRVDEMIKSGFIDEVVKLRKMGYEPDLKSMSSIGYHELNEYLDGKIVLDDAVEMIKTESKRYAKRQMTWYRRNKKIHWITNSELNKIKKLLHGWIFE